MFRRWWEKRGAMPYAIDRTCGHIDRFVEIMFRSRIDDLDEEALIGDDRNFEKMCRVIALTERRGYRQLEISPAPSDRPCRPVADQDLRHHQSR